MHDLKNVLRLEDLTESQRVIANAIGLEQYITLSRISGGATIRIPKEDTLDFYVIKRLIREERKNGCSISDIARRYKMDYQTVLYHLKN